MPRETVDRGLSGKEKSAQMTKKPLVVNGFEKRRCLERDFFVRSNSWGEGGSLWKCGSKGGTILHSIEEEISGTRKGDRG